MKRRNFFKIAPLAGLFGFVSPGTAIAAIPETFMPAKSDREYWVSLMIRIAEPVLSNLSKGTLKKNMPLEKPEGYGKKVEEVTYLEALGRTLAGISGWLSLPADQTAEGQKRAEFAEMARKSILNLVNPASPDYTDFVKRGESQLLVDAAFLSHAFLRAPLQLWEPLPEEGKKQVITALKSLRWIKPGQNNWLLFSAMVEIFLLKVGAEWEQERVTYAINKHKEWYKGDGWYGDGEKFHFDYYNGFVIQPMLVDILKILVEKGLAKQEEYELMLKRMQRFAACQERMISPEATYPAIGRSVVYRVGAFQPLAQLALNRQLPKMISPGQVRSALTAIMKRQFEMKGTFSKTGWLQLGFCGHQPQAAETYISTGSLYLCSVGFLPLGLPAEDVFWTSQTEDWSGKKAWSGGLYPEDHAVNF
ncbi:hypothetical protein SAMN05421820_102477 [Pedobacter steynii]|uniref:DUF2264 domain-containing protein n=1 Tax=Pedobacter steynii TaxID=430522 RepID=A0A1G9NYB6_9SPHI|nr:DUF2264 domain-containing protein [Pedobacter steynii]NQX39154.1 DUF2264 domain-containing protein [Pedobacter steynii]SDL91389.1 hypothetical protein SAMN05421820_102477 [Pedobacter steynii]